MTDIYQDNMIIWECNNCGNLSEGEAEISINIDCSCGGIYERTGIMYPVETF